MGKKRIYSYSSTDYAGRARAHQVRVHFKNTIETANVLRGMSIERGMAYLKNVMAHKECVPFQKFKGGVGRCAQAKAFKVTQGRWPEKSAKCLLDLLKNAISNAEYKGMYTERMKIIHIQFYRVDVESCSNEEIEMVLDDSSDYEENEDSISSSSKTPSFNDYVIVRFSKDVFYIAIILLDMDKDNDL
ncbi:hypothetical protein FQA39_LY07307 [Lamprigera yunnana]|nr:hypothetical protein FQA39_LY07307 [Lamprigera yunnana]